MSSRKQIETALLTITRQGRGMAAITARSQLKRLWLADRKMPCEGEGSKYPLRKNYAFFDGEMPGKGNAVSYSRHDAYLLCVAFKFLKLNWKPVTIVATCRMFRKALTIEYDRLISAKSSYGLEGKKLADADLIRLREGNFVREHNQLSWLVVTAGLLAGQRYERDSKNEDAPLNMANIVQSPERLSAVAVELTSTDGHAIVFEICNIALSLDYLLDIAPVVKRGRRPKSAN